MENNYFYIDGSGNQQGPVSAHALANCGINSSTLVWHAGMSDWKPAGQVNELRDIFQQTAGAMPPPHNTNAMGGNAYSTGYTGGYSYAQIQPCPDDHMTGAIIVTVIWFLLCFNLFGLIPGIIAIVKADKVSSFYRMGQYDQALLASTDAGKWVKYSVIGGILSIVVSIALVVIFFMAIGMSAASFAAVL